jgi:hypothetical protein
LLLVLFAVASLVAPEWFHSLFFFILYCIYTVMIFASVFFIPGFLRKILLFLVFCLMLGVIIEKNINNRFYLTLGQGGTYLVDTGRDTIELELQDFTITSGNQAGGPAMRYESRVLLNGRDTLSIRFHRPGKYENARLYQSTHKKITPFQFCYGDTILLFEGQTGTLNNTTFIFLEYDADLQRVKVKYNDILFHIPVDREYTFIDKPILISPQTQEFGSVLQYVEVRGHTILILLTLCTLLALTVTILYRK